MQCGLHVLRGETSYHTIPYCDRVRFAAYLSINTGHAAEAEWLRSKTPSRRFNAFSADNSLSFSNPRATQNSRNSSHMGGAGLLSPLRRVYSLLNDCSNSSKISSVRVRVDSAGRSTRAISVVKSQSPILPSLTSPRVSVDCFNQAPFENCLDLLPVQVHVDW